MSSAPQEAPEQFLFREAALLDDNDLRGWFAILDKKIDYRMPIRVAREPSGEADFSTTGFFYREDHRSLEARVERLMSDDAWCEHPRTRTRRMIGNVQTEIVDGCANLRSNLVAYAWRRNSDSPVIVTADRRDRLTVDGGEWKLLQRIIRLDTTVLGLQSLSIFL